MKSAAATSTLPPPERKDVHIYADGACSGNPGPGGWGAVLRYGGHERRLSQGFLRTTNNRMELRAVIAALEALKQSCDVTVVTDSQYVVNGITQGWACAWRRNGWRRKDKSPARNSDLWGRLLDLCEQHRVRFEWIRGHNGHPQNEICDRMAVEASHGGGRIVDTGFKD